MAEDTRHPPSGGTTRLALLRPLHGAARIGRVPFRSPRSTMTQRSDWPGGARFAFSVFDDPDSQTTAEGREVYALLADLGFRTTKGVWPVAPPRVPSDHGRSCDDAEHLAWIRTLEAQGFEIGYHNTTLHTSTREETARGLSRMAELFGGAPLTMAQHYNCEENIYWGDRRVGGWHRAVYNLATRGKNHDHFHGEDVGHALYWADLCRERIGYLRNFVFADIDTLAACPIMPYHDPERPAVRAWYASSEGANVESFVRTLAEANQDRLVQSGGACIMYTHFGHGFVRDGKLDARFVRLMTRLAGLGGWNVPVRPLLDHLRDRRGGQPHLLTDAQRRSIERRWVWHKLRFGTA